MNRSSLNMSSLDFSTLKSEEEETARPNIHYTISHGIQDSEGNIFYYIIMDKAGKAWMIKAGFIEELFNVVINQHLTPQGKDVPYFMKHFHEVPTKGMNGKYRRNKNNWVTTKVATVVKMPKAGLPHELCITNALDQVGSFMKRKDIGNMFATWLAREIPALYRHFAGNKMGGGSNVSKAQMGDEFTQTFNDEFKNYGCDYNVPLSKILCNYEIKQFLVNYLGCNSFDEVDDTELGKIFHYYPLRSHPAWENIRKESY